MGESNAVDRTRIRVVVHQPALADYRVPVFRELAGRPGLEVLVRYGVQRRITNVSPDGFSGDRVRILRAFGGQLMWCGGQIRDADPARADVLMYGWNTRYLSLLPALRRARRRGVGTVLWGHGTATQRESGWRRRIRRWFASQSDVVLFYDEATARRYVATYGLDAERVFVAPNSIDQSDIASARDRWLGDRDALEAFRREKRLGEGPVLLFVSRLIAKNRVDLLLGATAALSDQFDTLRVVIIGDGAARAGLENIAADLGLDDRVTFTGAVYGQEELAPWFLNADVFCYPDYVGLSLMHAFGYGLPVVTSAGAERHGPEFAALDDGVNGLTYPPGDTAALHECLATLLSDPARLERMGSAALDTVRHRFTIERMIDGMESAIRHAYRGG